MVRCNAPTFAGQHFFVFNKGKNNYADDPMAVANPQARAQGLLEKTQFPGTIRLQSGERYDIKPYLDRDVYLSDDGNKGVVVVSTDRLPEHWRAKVTPEIEGQLVQFALERTGSFGVPYSFHGSYPAYANSAPPLTHEQIEQQHGVKRFNLTA